MSHCTMMTCSTSVRLMRGVSSLRELPTWQQPSAGHLALAACIVMTRHCLGMMHGVMLLQWIQPGCKEGVIFKPFWHRPSEQRCKVPWCNTCSVPEPYSWDNTSRVTSVWKQQSDCTAPGIKQVGSIPSFQACDLRSLSNAIDLLISDVD